MTVLANAGAEVAATAPDVLAIAGLSSERVVATLTARHVPFTEVSAHRATLEEAYMELTRDAVEFRSAAGHGRSRCRPGPGQAPAARHDRDRALPLAGRPGRDGFAQALRAEWTKFRTVRGWVIGALVGVWRWPARAARLGRRPERCQAVGANGQPSSGGCGGASPSSSARTASR